MSYFVTGGSGFIGRRLVKKLLGHKKKIYCLLLECDKAELENLYAFWGIEAARVIPVTGDLTRPMLGVSEAEQSKLRGRIKHMFHLAAIYDLEAPADIVDRVNVQGTRNAVEFAEAMRVGCFHLTSSIAAAGLYEGVFREDMFEEAENLDNPYFRSKHESEEIVRKECKRPWRVYRPAVVVGHSETGEMDKSDGPYYFFKLIQKLRNILPPWMPAIGLEGGRLNLVPVDFVVNAMDHIAHLKGLDGRCFHLVDPSPRRIGDILNIFARAAHAPQMNMRINPRMFGFVPSAVKLGLSMLPPVRRISQQILAELGVPKEVLRLVNYPTRFDCRETQTLLAGTGIEVPPLEGYADKLWDYWERNLDPDLLIDRSLSGHVQSKVVIVTGASSGIGKATALKLGEAGAKVILVARGEEKLLETTREIAARGGTPFAYTADLADMSCCDDLVRRVQQDHGSVDILINNAGRSIRRAVVHSFNRFHDFERSMQLNYFGSLRLILGFLPAMLQNGGGHIINISSIGVLSNAPRFSAYVASKGALDAFSRCASAEFVDMGIKFTTINMPLVRTPMIAPTKVYETVPTLSPEEAADLVAQAIIYQPTRIATRLGVFTEVANAVAPRWMQMLLNTAFRMFPESTAARGLKEPGERASPEQVAFAQFTRGIHW